MNNLTTVTSINPHITALDRASLNLQQAIREATLAVRNIYADANLSDVLISIYVSGRVHGDLKVEIKAEDLTATSAAKSYDLATSVREFLRRKGWDKENAPVLISFTNEVKQDTDGGF